MQETGIRKDKRMDQLRIKDLEVYAYHGLFGAEKELGQRFVLDLILDYDMTRAAKTGDLTASIHYGELAQDLTHWCQESKEDLIETLAYKLIDRIFLTHPLVQKVSLEVKKPWAPVPLPLETCSVKLVRQKRKAFIALGSNQGNPAANLDAALEKMAELLPEKRLTSEIISNPTSLFKSAYISSI